MTQETDNLINLMNQLKKSELTVSQFLDKIKDLITNKNTDLTAKDTIEGSKANLLHHLIERNEVSNPYPKGITSSQMQKLLPKNKKLMTEMDGNGHTPFQVFLDQLSAGKWTPFAYKELLNLLISSGANLKAQDSSEGNTLLHLLVLNNHIFEQRKVGNYHAQITSLLNTPENKGLLKLKNNAGLTPLQSLMNQRVDNQCPFEDFRLTAHLLVSNGADVTLCDSRDQSKASLLHLLIKGKATKEIGEVLKKDKSVVNQKDANGDTPLQILMNLLVAKQYTFEKFKAQAMTLVDAGADVLVRDSTEKSNKTLLHFLIDGNQNGTASKEITSIVKLKPEIIDIKDGSGETSVVFLNTRMFEAKWSRQEVNKTASLLPGHAKKTTSPTTTKTNSATPGLNPGNENPLTTVASNPSLAPISEKPTGPTLTKTKSQLLNKTDIEQAMLGDSLTPTLPTSDSAPGGDEEEPTNDSPDSVILDDTSPNPQSLTTGTKDVTPQLLTQPQRAKRPKSQKPHTRTVAPAPMPDGDTPGTEQGTVSSGAEPTQTNVQEDSDTNPENPSYDSDMGGELYAAIKALKDYGTALNEEKEEEKGKLVIDLAKELKSKTRQFINNGYGTDSQNQRYDNVEGFRKDLKDFMNQHENALAGYRLNWGTLLLNIAIALTGIGVVAIGIKLGYSAIANSNHRPTFFGQSEMTHRESLAMKVNELSNLTPSL